MVAHAILLSEPWILRCSLHVVAEALFFSSTGFSRYFGAVCSGTGLCRIFGASVLWLCRHWVSLSSALSSQTVVFSAACSGTGFVESPVLRYYGSVGTEFLFLRTEISHCGVQLGRPHTAIPWGGCKGEFSGGRVYQIGIDLGAAESFRLRTLAFCRSQCWTSDYTLQHSAGTTANSSLLSAMLGTHRGKSQRNYGVRHSGAGYISRSSVSQSSQFSAILRLRLLNLRSYRTSTVLRFFGVGHNYELPSAMYYGALPNTPRFLLHNGFTV